MMSYVPAVCGGDVAMMLVSLTTVKSAGIVPKLTSLAPVKAVPVMVTSVPPAEVPLVGLMLVMAGAAATVKVNRSAFPKADVPPGVVTVMSQVPAGLGGVTA